MTNIYRFKKRSDAIAHVIESWRMIANHAIVSSGRFTVALSGGTSPISLYQALAKEKKILWPLTHIFLVDERFVSYANSNSNYRMIRKTLIDKIPLNMSQVHPIEICQTPNQSATAYARKIKNFFKLKLNTFPSFDLILLGLGEDGHTASLFTNSDCDEKKKLAIHTRAPKSPHDRITLTLPVLNYAKNIIFFVLGKDKEKIVHRIFKKEQGDYPASKIKPVSKEMTVIFSN